MANLVKRPIVIQDLIAHATYISLDNLDASDRFLHAAEATFQRIAELPNIGRLSGFSNLAIAQIRQYPIKGFNKYIIFYQIHPETVEVIRVLHGAQNLEFILDNDQIS
ncbi:type II toxin-antitoxin system RelE/ParE family toxin [Nodosilinea sp. LEGE 07088]|uniref:type II toxin-antitoxin system RelE/ParE family toxin n=1 Tax=Nodosilinea sp. LEGE 07088 TaxID=2777968 RepID=UPI00188027C2|nr:type II toxin-antitoxin system RelE/ParE family toxin [Nodosilinea sp. LEGE 07088]MBE9141077.1 type II toxin-antitoxin system RelE/ParE family toxin [Nodosilinea sp. LEGE 07088]